MPYQFQYSVHGNKQFEANLKKEQCTHVNSITGHRCKRFVVIGLPLCYQHLAIDDKLKIKKSTITHGGKGLFAYDGNKNDNSSIVFKKDSKILKYQGEHINENTLAQRYGNHTAPYAIKLKTNSYIDSATQRYAASLINSTRGTNKIKNVKLSNPSKGDIFIKAVKNIRNGDELLTSYGQKYKFNEPQVKSKTVYV